MKASTMRASDAVVGSGEGARRHGRGRTPHVRCALVAVVMAAVVAAWPMGRVAVAQTTFTKANNLNNLNLTTSWSTGTAPGSGDVALFDSTYATTGTLSVTGVVGWGGLTITNPVGSVLVNSGTIGIGTYGIDMSSATADLVIKGFRMDGSQTWNIGSGRTFRIGDTTATSGGGTQRAGTFTNNSSGSTITKSGAGTAILDMSNNSLGNVNWVVNAGLIRAIWNSPSAWGTGSITLGGGGIAVGTPFSGSVGNWTWNNNITLSNTTSSYIDNQNVGGSDRWLKLEGIISGSGNLEFRDTGTAFNNVDCGFVLTGVNTFSGTMTIASAAEVRVGGAAAGQQNANTGNNGTLGASTAPVVNNGTLTFSRNDAHTVGNAISGSGLVRVGVVTSGLGLNTSQVLTLTASNSYSGGTQLNGGQLNINDARAIGTGTLTIAASGTIDNTSGAGITLSSNNAQAWNSNFTFVGTNPLNLGTGAVTLNANRQVTVTSSTLTVGGAIGGAFNLTKAGGGTLVLNGVNTYTGTTTVSAGLLSITRLNALQSGTAVTVTSGTVEFNANNIFTAGHGVAMAAARVITATGAGATILISGGESRIGNVTLANGGVLTSNRAFTSSPNGYDWLIANVDGAGTAATVAVTGNAAATMNGSGGIRLQGVQNFNVADVTGNANADLSVSLILGDPGTSGGSAGGVRKQGAGTMAISTQAQYTGGTIIDAGVLDLTGGGGGSGVIRGTATVNTGGVLQLSTGDALGFSGGATALTAINLVGGTMNVNTGSNQTLGSGTITMTGGAITGTTTGNIDFFGGSSALVTLASSATSTISGVQISPTRQGNTTFTVAAGTTPSGIDLDISSVLRDAPTGEAASGILTKAGAGTMRLSAPNTYTKSTTISAGTIIAGGTSALGTSGTVTLNDASTGSSATSLLIDASTASGTVSRPIVVANLGSGVVTIGDWSSAGSNVAVFSGSVTLNRGATFTGLRTTFSGGIGGAGGVTVNSSGTVSLTGTSSYAGSTTISSGTLEIGGSGVLGAGAYAGAIANAGGLSIATSANQTLSGVVSGVGSLSKSGAGRLTLTGTSTYGGATTITGGTLQVGGAGQLGSGAYAGAVTNNAALEFLSSANQTLAGGIGGTGTLRQAGTGKLTLAGNNTYSGATTVSNGSLLVNGVVSSSTITVSGGVLGGSGTTADVALVGGVVSPGNSPGNLTVGNISWDSTSSYTWQMYQYQAGEGVGWDMLTGTGALTVTGTGFTFNLVSLSAINPDVPGQPNQWSATTSGTFRVATFAGGISGTSPGWYTLNTGSFTGIAPTGAFSLNVTNTDMFLVYTYIQPAAWIWQVGEGVWSDGANWSTTTAPAGTVDLVYSGPGGVSTNDIPSGTGDGQISSVTSLTFSGSAGGSYTLAGNAFNLGGVGILNSSTFSQTIQNGLTLVAPSQANAEAAGLLLSGTIDTAGYPFTVTGSFGTMLTGMVTGSGSLAKGGDGTLTLAGSNDYTGGMVITGGTVVVGDGSTNGVLPGNVTNNAALVFNRSDDVTFPGNIGGTGSLAKLGGNTLTLSGSNGWAGATTISGGTLALTSAANQTLAGAITGAGALSKSGAGTLTLTGSGGYTGGTTITAGTLQLGAGATAGSITGDVNNAGTMVFNRSDSVTFAGAISGAGSLRQAGSGATTLTGANSYAGNTTIASGTLVLGGAGVLGGGSYAGAIANEGALSYASSMNQTLSGTISGVGSLSASGPGTLTLTAANSYTGGTTLSAGTIRLGNNAALGTGTATLSGGRLSSDGVTGRTLTNVLAVTGNVTLGDAVNTGLLTFSGSVGLGGGSRTITTPSDVTFSSIVANGTLTKAGAGTLTLSSSNPLTSPVTINAGTIKVGNKNSLGDFITGRPVTQVVVNAGGAVDFNGVIDATYGYTISGSGPSGAGALVNTGAAIGTTIAQTSNLKLAGNAAIGGTGDWGLIASGFAATTLDLNGFTLTKVGANTISLAKTTISNSGTIVISQGTLSQTNTGATGTGATITLADTAGATLNLNSLAMTIGALSGGGASGGNVALGSATLTVGGLNTSTTYSGSIGGTGGLTKNGSGTLTLAGTSAYTGATTVSAGTLAFTGNNSVGASLAGSAGAVVAFGGNTLTLGISGATVTVSYFGTLNGTGTLAFRGGSATITGSDGTAGANTNYQLFNTAVALSPTPFALDTGTSATDRRDFIYQNDTNTPLVLSSLSGYGALRNDNGGTSATRFITVNQAVDTTFNGALVSHKSGAGVIRSITFEKQGIGALTLAGFVGKETNSAGAGPTPLNLIANGGLLSVTNAANTTTTNADARVTGTVTITSGTLGFSDQALINTAGSAGFTVIQMNGGVLRWNTGNTQDITAGGRLALVSDKNATFDINGNDVTLGSALGGGEGISASVTKIGAGALTLSGGNSFSGGVTLTTGRLNVNSLAALGSGMLSIAAGTTLDNTSGGAISLPYANAQAWNGDFTFVGTRDLDFGTGAVTLSESRTVTVSASTLTVGGIGSGAVSLTKAGAGTLVITGASTYEGDTTISSGTLRIGGSGQLGSGAYAGAISMVGTLDYASSAAQTLSGTISGGAPLLKTGNGTLTLSTSNAYTGGTQLNAGTLSFANGGLGPSGDVTFAANSTLQWADGNTQDISSRLVLPNSGDVTLDTGANAVALTGNFGTGAAGGVTKAGAGTLTLTGTTGYAGTTSINAGTLAIAGAGSIAASPLVTVGWGAALDISGASGGVTVNELAGSGVVNLGNNTLQSIVTSRSGVFDGVITGSGGFTKAGGGLLELTGSQAFTGAATVAAGTLQIDRADALASAARIVVRAGARLSAIDTGLTVFINQMLGGYGVVNGDVTFDPGAVVSPGGSVGTLGINGLATLSGSAAYAFDITNAGGTAGYGWDLLNVGSLAITSGTADPYRILLTSLTSGTDDTPGPMDPNNWNPNSDYQWLFIHSGSPIDAIDSNAFVFDTTNFAPYNTIRGIFSVAWGGAIGKSDSDLYITYAAIPEPGTLALAGIGLAAAGWALHRRRRSLRVKA